MYLHFATHTHTLFTEHPLARHCPGTTDTAANKMCTIPVPKDVLRGSGLHKQEKLPMTLSAAEAWEKKGAAGRPLGTQHLR